MEIKISLIGEINSGKSTLFNILTDNKNKSIVSDIKGTTRDRIYGNFIYNKKDLNIKIIDTGSFLNNPNLNIVKKIYYQTNIAIKESKIIFFITNVNSINNNSNIKLINLIKKYNKKIVLIINKIDILNKNNNINLFGIKDVFYISAKNKNGIKNIYKYLINLRKDENLFKNISIYNDYKCIKNTKILVIGKSNVGKSTFINKILNEKRLITSCYEGTTINNIKINFKIKNVNFILNDTFGINNIFYNSNNNKYKTPLNKITLSLLKYNDIIIFIIDIKNLISKIELEIINKIIKKNKILILIINKIDLLEKKNINYNLNYIKNKINFIKFIKIYLLSLKNIKNLNYIKNFIYNIFCKYNKKIKTNLVNNVLKKFNIEKKNIINKKIKFKYAILINKPLFNIKIYGKNFHFLNKSNIKYIENYFRNNLNLEYINFKIIFINNF